MGKEKKKHKKKQRSKHSKSRKSSSSEEEWVEMNPVPSTPVAQLSAPVEREKQEERTENDDWLMNPAFLACKSRDEIRPKRENNKDKKEHDKYMLDNLGQTNRELNPYWKDGGTGLPEEVQVAPEALRQAAVTVGDQGVAWLRKALQRAKEQAAEQGRSLEQVVAERWGSLEKLESMITAAEEREQNAESSFQSNSKYRHGSSKSRSKYSVRRSRNEDQSEYSHINKNKTESNEAISERKSYNERDNKTNRIKYEQNSEKCSQLFKKPKESDDDTLDDKRKSCVSKSKSSDKQKSNTTDNHCGRSRKENERCNRKYDKRSSKRDVSKKKHSSIRSESTSSSSEDDRHHKKYKTDVRRDTPSKKKQSRRRFERSSSSSSDSSDYSSSESNHYKKNESSQDTKKGAKGGFIKPHNDSDDNSVGSSNQRQSYKQKQHSSSSQGWRKKTQSSSKDCVNVCDEEQESSIQESTDNKNEVRQESPIEAPQVLTDKEMNDLGAKLVKAELLGNEELARELKTKLERAREAKANLPNESKESEEVVLLTHTDSKGFTRPVSLSGPLEPAGGRRKAKKVETHTDGKRMRYFADDDKYSLQEMFQREKLSTVEDSNAVFAKLASKGVGRDDSARDMDDVFEETAQVEEVDGRKHARERQQAIEQSKRTARSLDNCQWCLESKQMLKHLIVAMGRTCYLCVPPYQSLTDNHCLLVPSYHTPCATQLDEDVWREMQDFRKSVVQMFLSQDEDVVFFESARTLNKFPHMVINCVPMPKETGDLAPIYFKKAIQECEMEWSNNKKLVELKGRDVRKAVPRGLPYFAVDFGMESGFAHVIEDEKLFPQNFAQEIIGGMLDLDHTIWRKQKKQTFEEQSRKVIQLTKLWNPFDCTK